MTQYSSQIDEYINSLKNSKTLGGNVVYSRILPPRTEILTPLKQLKSPKIKKLLKSLRISSLYSHQMRAIDMINSGKHVVVATPTASGKTLIYNIPVLDRILKKPETRALYLFPLKALAQDQLRAFEEITSHCDSLKINAAIYDGDTSDWHRRKIRENPPHVIMTNPEMLHLSFLPYHEKWREFFLNLDVVVVDEVHTYRGVMGSHMAQVFRRFRRVCDAYHRHPAFILSSATISNPSGLSEALTGLTVHTEANSGAPQGKRHFVFLNPSGSPSSAAILLLKAALHREMRTIVYTQSRKMSELIAIWAGSQKGKFSGKISAYRAGFLPEERRIIEKKLSSGELLSVVSTSALELGIDIGDLDLCLLVGYPGTVMSTWQRGGRVGRSGHDSAIILIAGEDALDQYFMRYPDEFFFRKPEAAVINPHNPDIVKKHLVCAAAELPLKIDDPYFSSPQMVQNLCDLEKNGDLLKNQNGDQFYASKYSPHRLVDLRGTGSRYHIISTETGAHLGEIDGYRAVRETHPGAIYLHQGQTYHIDSLDTGAKIVRASQSKSIYYTRVRGHKETEILDIFKEKQILNTHIWFGRLKVTDQVTGYEKRHIHGNKRIDIIPLDLPPQIFETEGIWVSIESTIVQQAEEANHHFMGGIHALEHAIIGLCPLFVLTDRNDFGGISTPFHPQVESAAIFVYDGIPGGIGLTFQAYEKALDLMHQTQKLIKSCPCETGCPSCVHSPKCGSGNRPIDKSAALFILDRLIGAPSSTRPPSIRKIKTLKKSQVDFLPQKHRNFCVLDIETKHSAEEVGGWHMAHRMGISCAVLYDSTTDSFVEFYEHQITQLIEILKKFKLIIGFNIKRFDFHVMSGYSDFDFNTLPTLDLLEFIYHHLGYRISLDHLAEINLGVKKSADGLQALQWWKQGRIDDILAYCKKDVEITKNIYILGAEQGYLLFKNKAGQLVRIPVNWR
jgi:DEAD/DEAH box helicase domain-containing protein